MRSRRRTRSDWDDPDEVTLEGILEDHDDELGEHDRTIYVHTASIDELRTRVIELETARSVPNDQVAVLTANQNALIDHAAAQSARGPVDDMLDWMMDDSNDIMAAGYE